MRDPRVTAVILAGGAGERVGGQDKGWLQWRGRALVEHAFAGIAPQVANVVISANRNLERYRTLGVAVFSDAVPGHAGPLAGIVRAFDGLATTWLVTLPVDVPVFPGDLVSRLLDAANRAGAPAAVVHDGERTQNLFALYAAQLGGAARAAFDGGERAAWRFQRDCGAAHAPFTVNEFDAPDLTTLVPCPR